MGLKKVEALGKIKIELLDKSTVFITSNDYLFSYTSIQGIFKDDLISEHRYFGGLQCNYHSDSVEYKNLENWLCEVAEMNLNFIYPNNNFEKTTINSTQKGGKVSGSTKWVDRKPKLDSICECHKVDTYRFTVEDHENGGLSNVDICKICDCVRD